MIFRDDRLRESARGQPCHFRIGGVCCGDPATTVLCHDRRGFLGAGLKPPDWKAAFGCHACHSVMDRRAKMPGGDLISAEDAAYYWARARDATLDYWFKTGLVCVTDGDQTKAGGSA